MNFDPDPARLFDEHYYKHCCGPESYARTELFLKLWANVAECIVRDFSPTTVLDVGCAIGMLVEASRERGVDAQGFDISGYAIGQVPEGLIPYVRQGSILDPAAATGTFDLVVCIEVVEHLSPQDADKAIENLCRWGNRILFSSSPSDYQEVTHFNVRSPGYWAEKFARNDFVHMVDYDASYVQPWAALYQRKNLPWSSVIRSYEDEMFVKTKEIVDLRNLANKMQAERQQFQATIQTLQAQLDSSRSIIFHIKQLLRLLWQPILPR